MYAHSSAVTRIPAPTRSLLARSALVGLAAAAGLLVAACSASEDRTMPMPAGDTAAGASVTGAQASQAVIESPVYALEAGEATQADRVAALTAVVERLRADSTSGWQVRQSDTTGFASEISGGRLAIDASPVEAVEVFMERYGSLFGPTAGLEYGLNGYDDTGFATVWVEQAVDGVPVDGAQVIASVRTRGSVSEVQSLAGTLVDVAGAALDPTVTDDEAVDIVSQALEVEASPQPVLVVTTHQGAARLAWAVTVESGPQTSEDSLLSSMVQYPALVFVDAREGTILGHRVSATSPLGRAASASVRTVSTRASGSAIDYGNYGFSIPRGGRPVVIESSYLGRIPIEVNAQQLPDGSIILVDATGVGASTATKKGLIVGLDGRGVTAEESGGDLVSAARIIRYRNVTSIPQDALYAMWGARQTLDYLKDELGMLSFDGNNSPVPIVYNYTDGDSCMDNAYFATAPGLSHMAVGIPCPDEEGNSIPTVADIDTIAHELGHGVVHSHEFSRSTIQQGALDEGLADYLGMILRNSAFGEASPVASADICRGYPGYHAWCRDWKDGTGIRSLNTGATFGQYAFTIEDVLANTAASLYADSGHTNSMVWSNALWQARKAVASLDGGDMATSELVREFDRAVIRASTRWTPGTGFGAAAEAVVRSVAESGMSPRSLNLIRDRFRASGICQDCRTELQTAPSIIPVAVSTAVKARPVALNDQVGYLVGASDGLPAGALVTLGSSQQKRVGPPSWATTHISGSGTTVLQAQVDVSDDGSEEYPFLSRTDALTGAYDVVSEDVNAIVAPAASAEAYVWVGAEGEIRYQPVNGAKVRTLDVGEAIAQVATGAGKVAFLTGEGRLRVWTVSTNTVRDLAVYSPEPYESFVPEELTLPVGALAMSGDRIAVVGSTVGSARLQVFNLTTNTKVTLSESAYPLGVAINSDYVVWVENEGTQSSPIFGEDEDAEAYAYPETELLGYAFSAKKKYRMVDFRGQQAYPSLSATGLLAWQETGNGNSDIYAMRLADQ